MQKIALKHPFFARKKDVFRYRIFGYLDKK